MSDAQLSFRKSANVDRVTDKRKDSLFRLVDTDGSGTIDAQEFAVLYDAIKKDLAEELEKEAALQKEASSARRRVKMLLLFVAVLVSFLAASVAANFAVIFTVVDQAVTTTTTSTGLLEVKGTDTIAKTAIATQDVPFMVAPAMDMDTLSEVKSLKVTYSTGMSGNRVRAQLTVVGVRKHNSTFVEFVTDVAGETVEILNGVASLVRYPNAANRLMTPRKLAICSANVTCSAFRASGIDTNAALATARAELEKAGFRDASRRLDDPFFDSDECVSGSWMTGSSSSGAKILYYTGYEALTHVVFVLHGLGGSQDAMWNIYGLDQTFEKDEFRHLVFVFPTSGITTTKGNGNTAMGWCDDTPDPLTYETGALVLDGILTGGELSGYGVGSASEAMVVGFSNGGALATFVGWGRGDTYTSVVAIDYMTPKTWLWLAPTYGSPGAVGFAAHVYYACESPVYLTHGVAEPTDPTEMTYWSGIGLTYSDGVTASDDLTHSLGSEFPSALTFSTTTWASAERFFKWSVHGEDSSGSCNANTIPNTYGGQSYPSSGNYWSNNLWNVHMAMPEVTKESVVEDILAWVTPPPSDPDPGPTYRPGKKVSASALKGKAARAKPQMTKMVKRVDPKEEEKVSKGFSKAELTHASESPFMFF